LINGPAFAGSGFFAMTSTFSKGVISQFLSQPVHSLIHATEGEYDRPSVDYQQLPNEVHEQLLEFQEENLSSFLSVIMLPEIGR
jgi:hypothetical protein